jgi:hypothetical protein
MRNQEQRGVRGLLSKLARLVTDSALAALYLARRVG